MLQRTAYLVLAVALLLVVACGTDPSEPATGSSPDTAAGQDGGDAAGAVDASGAADGAADDAAGGGGADGGAADATGPDVVPPDAGPADAEPADTTGRADVQPLDSATPDAEDAAQVDAEDAAQADAAEDAAGADSSSTDAELQDAGSVDSGAEDAATPDAATPDDGLADTATPEDVAPVCVPTAPTLETCDGVDNDCDGQTDNGVSCEDGNPCTVGNCGVVQGQVQCIQQAGPNDGAPCDDGSACSPASACSGGFCKGNTACDDGIACTTDSCDPAVGCSHTGSDALCDDGNVCTSQACELGKGCTTTAIEGPCDDGNACTQVSVCGGGVCKGSQPLNCDDGNACTDDACDSQTGCKHTANAASCDDGDPCTSGEACAASTCKGGAAKCDDGNICTLDACSAAGTCSNAAIAGCKVCAANSDCNDNKACTTDTCTAGKCTWAPIQGCVGETDYTVTSFASNKPTVSAGVIATFSVGVTNLGKAWPGGTIPKMKWEVWFSVDDKIDAADALVLTKTWSSFNIGGPTNISATETATWTYGKPANWYHKYQCVRVVYSVDANPADNTQCIPVVVEDGEVGLEAIVAQGSMLKSSYNANVSTISTLVVATNNPGSKAIQPLTNVYLSQDDKWDAADKLIGANVKPTVAAGKSTTTLTFPTYQFQSAITGTTWVCVRSDIDVAAFESVPGDNTVCGQVAFENPAELVHGDPTFTNGYLTFDSATPWTVVYGAAAACKKMGVYNVGLGKITGGFKSRCFLSTTGTAASAGWMFEWQQGSDVASGQLNCSGGYTCGAKVDFTSPVGPPVLTPALGATKLCIEVNHDKAILETDYANNTLCVPVTINGANMQVNPKLTAENKGLPLVLKVGVGYTDTFAITNVGNVDLVGVDGKFLARIMLSTDNKLSADDVQLWQGVQSGFNSFTKASGLLQTHYALPTPTTKPTVTVPPGTAAGSYFLLYVVNADGLFVEPQGDNVFAKPATVQL